MTAHDAVFGRNGNFDDGICATMSLVAQHWRKQAVSTFQVPAMIRDDVAQHWPILRNYGRPVAAASSRRSRITRRERR